MSFYLRQHGQIEEHELYERNLRGGEKVFQGLG